jgi:Mce-associated membrane protein
MNQPRHRATTIERDLDRRRSPVARLQSVIGRVVGRFRAHAALGAIEDAAVATQVATFGASSDTAATDDEPVQVAAADSESDVASGEPDGDQPQHSDGARSRTPGRLGGTAVSLMVASLAALTSWVGYHAYQSHQTEQQRDLFLQVGRQAALNLTTIRHTEVDADVKRILDSSTGTFHDDFQQRSQPLVDLVKQDQSTSVGTITGAGLQSMTADSARVLVSVSVKTTAAGDPEPHLNSFRMRLDVKKIGHGAKVSRVEFIS